MSDDWYTLSTWTFVVEYSEHGEVRTRWCVTVPDESDAFVPEGAASEGVTDGPLHKGILAAYAAREIPSTLVEVPLFPGFWEEEEA